MSDWPDEENRQAVRSTAQLLQDRRYPAGSSSVDEAIRRWLHLIPGMSRFRETEGGKELDNKLALPCILRVDE
jgi:hypothetical protein